MNIFRGFFSRILAVKEEYLILKNMALDFPVLEYNLQFSSLKAEILG